MSCGIDALTVPLELRSACGVGAAPDVFVRYLVAVFRGDVDIAGGEEACCLPGPGTG